MSVGFQLPVLGLKTHIQKVKTLYKKALRNMRAYHSRIPDYRIQAVLLRNRFDQNRDIKDMIAAKICLQAGEEELFKWTHYAPIKFRTSMGGTAFEREVIPPDWVVDYWHPLEKAAYPDYFARREERKKCYEQWWNETYGHK